MPARSRRSRVSALERGPAVVDSMPMRIVTIDCLGFGSESEFWKAYLSASRPEGAGFFGRNLDAFRDALQGGPGWPGECTLRFTNTATVEPLRDGAFLRALRDIANESQNVRIELI